MADTVEHMFTTMSTSKVESELVELAGHLAAGTCRFLRLLAEFDRRGGWAGPGIRSCAHWLNWRVGLSLRTARDHLRVAHALRTLPAITAVFAAGRVSYSKVRALTRIATPATENGLLIVALQAARSAAQLRALRIRDRGRCVFPGCTTSRRLDAHHIRWWHRGGPTDLDNLALICRHHHTLLHDHHYRMSRTTSGFAFARPDGSPIPNTGDPTSRSPARAGHRRDLRPHLHPGVGRRTPRPRPRPHLAPPRSPTRAAGGRSGVTGRRTTGTVR